MANEYVKRYLKRYSPAIQGTQIKPDTLLVVYKLLKKNNQH